VKRPASRPFIKFFLSRNILARHIICMGHKSVRCLQEAFLAASLQLKDYARSRSMPFFLWLRLVAGQKLVALHRHHLGRKIRNADREVI